MKRLESLLTTVLALSSTANPIYEASTYTKLVRKAPHGILYRVAAPDTLPFSFLHVYGSARERGEAHGYLLSEQIIKFSGEQLDAFFSAYVSQINLDGLPAWLQAAIRKLLPLGEKVAPAIFDLALSWVEQTQRAHNNASAALYYDEMTGIAHGVCMAAAETDVPCDESKLRQKIFHLNMLPDLIKMQCSMLGASNTATPDGHLVQLRSLDFGGGPFANNSVFMVHHPSATQASSRRTTSHPFASLSFPGFVGVVTGFTATHALSEKVNDVSGGNPNPPGTYEGESTSFVIRDMLELADSGSAAVTIAQQAKRTWGVWLGVGDSGTGGFGVIEYMQASANVYDATSLPKLSSQPALTDLAFLDKHAQPSHELKMYTALKSMLGNVTADNIARTLPRADQSGDVHIAIYDYSPVAPAVLLALGQTDANYTYKGAGGRPAWSAPFVRFEMLALWNEVPPV